MRGKHGLCLYITRIEGKNLILEMSLKIYCNKVEIFLSMTFIRILLLILLIENSIIYKKSDLFESQVHQSVMGQAE